MGNEERKTSFFFKSMEERDVLKLYFIIGDPLLSLKTSNHSIPSFLKKKETQKRKRCALLGRQRHQSDHLPPQSHLGEQSLAPTLCS